MPSGSVFGFSLALPAGAAMAAGRAASGSGSAATLAPFGQSRRILIADDYPEMRLLLRDMLEPLGMEILEADTGTKALEVAGSGRPDIILMDWRMPGLDGVAVTRAIRAKQDIAQPKIVMVTANAFDENRDEAIAAGADDFLSKPIELGTLYRIIERHAAIATAAGTAAAAPVPAEAAELSAADVAGIPEEIRDRLCVALRELSPARIVEALAELRPVNRELADRIESCVNNLQYRHLWKIFNILGE